MPQHLKALVNRELDRLELLLKQIKTVEAARDALLAVQQTATPAAMLLDIRGIGPEFAAVLWSEGLFRHFENRRQIAAYAGLAPTPWQRAALAKRITSKECPVSNVLTDDDRRHIAKTVADNLETFICSNEPDRIDVLRRLLRDRSFLQAGGKISS